MPTNSLRGFVGQGMGGRKSLRGALVQPLAIVDATSGSGSLQAPATCVALIYLTGAGASGASNAGTAGGGGGGAALYKRVRLAANQNMQWSVGSGGALLDHAA